MSKDKQVYLWDMLEALETAANYTSGMTQEQFLADAKTQDAVIRQLTVVGEAANKVGREQQMLLPHIPWSLLIGLRNKLVHDYAGVSSRLIWNSLQQDLPPLQTALRNFLQSPH